MAWSRPRAHHGLSRPTSVFRIIIIIDMYKFYPARLRFGSTRAKTCFGVKTENGQAIKCIRRSYSCLKYAAKTLVYNRQTKRAPVRVKDVVVNWLEVENPCAAGDVMILSADVDIIVWGFSSADVVPPYDVIDVSADAKSNVVGESGSHHNSARVCVKSVKSLLSFPHEVDDGCISTQKPEAPFRISVSVSIRRALRFASGVMNHIGFIEWPQPLMQLWNLCTSYAMRCCNIAENTGSVRSIPCS